MTSFEFNELDIFEEEMAKCLKEFFPTEDTPRLFESTAYSLQTGGKRFRPALCFAAAKALNIQSKDIVHWAIAIEWVHTYSLIHDDLPMMDDDDLRRGQATNHKKFDEATALLSGDALLTEAFGLVLEKYGARPDQAVALSKSLAGAIGSRGMILGQVLDFYFDPGAGSMESLSRIHNLKTGCLIGLCFEGAAILAGRNEQFVDEFKKMGVELGLAFQIKDDLLDANDFEDQSFLKFKSSDEVERLLKKISEGLIENFSKTTQSSDSLCKLISFNQMRNR